MTPCGSLVLRRFAPMRRLRQSPHTPHAHWRIGAWARGGFAPMPDKRALAQIGAPAEASP